MTNTEMNDMVKSLTLMIESVQDKPEQLKEVVPQIILMMQSLYNGFYSWYLSIGAPGGASHEEFNAWLEML